MTKVKHVLGISGGKDSAALAIYLNDNYPELDIEYYSCDTGKELIETYQLIENLEIFLGKNIRVLKAAPNSPEDPFDHFLQVYGGYLPSSISRWCTKELKLKPFEKYIAVDGPVVSYVGIRGDEDREGYISKKSNIQSIFPFRKNIWSEDVILKVLNNSNIPFLKKLYHEYGSDSPKTRRILEIVSEPLSMNFPQDRKLDMLLDLGIRQFNRVVFAFLKTTDYPLSQADDFPLVENEDILVKEDIFQILRDSGVGIPAYYNQREYTVKIDGELKRGYYARTRSGCFFCFFQQKIEWVWLCENHPELFQKAMIYEKDGFTWGQNETLAELAQEKRREQIKREHFLRTEAARKNATSDFLVDILGEEEREGCAACFV